MTKASVAGNYTHACIMYMCNTVLYIFITCFSYDIIMNRDIYKKNYRD